MRDGTFTTRADVYAQEIPDASDSVLTSESALLQTFTPVADNDVPDSERHGDVDGTRVDQIDSTATFDAHPASSKWPTSYSETTDTEHCTETIENDVCDASPTPQAVALSIARSAFEFGSDPDGRSGTQDETDHSESRLSRVQRNGFDTDKKKTPVVRRNDNSCVVDCIYFTQQCCECVIF